MPGDAHTNGQPTSDEQEYYFSLVDAYDLEPDEAANMARMLARANDKDLHHAYKDDEAISGAFLRIRQNRVAAAEKANLEAAKPKQPQGPRNWAEMLEFARNPPKPTVAPKVNEFEQQVLSDHQATEDRDYAEFRYKNGLDRPDRQGLPGPLPAPTDPLPRNPDGSVARNPPQGLNELEQYMYLHREMPPIATDMAGGSQTLDLGPDPAGVKASAPQLTPEQLLALRTGAQVGSGGGLNALAGHLQRVIGR